MQNRMNICHDLMSVLTLHLTGGSICSTPGGHAAHAGLRRGMQVDEPVRHQALQRAHHWVEPAGEETIIRHFDLPLQTRHATRAMIHFMTVYLV